MASREEMSTSFGAAAGTYESGRPEYPAAAVEWMLAPARGAEGALRVADVGAGTGKLTRAVQTVTEQVMAIDPDPGMLAELRAHLPRVPTHVGSAERMPLPDASLDAVVLGQAWHWVEPAAGSAEAARVLRPGGVLGLVWNIRDEKVDWVRRLTAIMHGSHAEQSLAEGDPQVAEPFGPIERAEWRWSRPMTRATLFDMARSRSYIITATDAERSVIGAELAALFDEVGAVGDAVVELPYVTIAFRAVRG